MEAKKTQVERLESDLASLKLQNSVLERQQKHGEAAIVELEELKVRLAVKAEHESVVRLAQTELDAQVVRERDEALASADVNSVLLAKMKEQLARAEAERDAAISARDMADRSQDYLREQYAQSEGSNVVLREEKAELEKELEIVKERVEEGVRLVRSTFELRIKDLEWDAKSWRDTAMFLQEKDRRSNSEDILRRAGEAPELAKKVEQLKEQLNRYRLDMDDMAAHLAEKDMELRELGEEKERLIESLREQEGQQQQPNPDSQSSPPQELDVVYRCEWRDMGSDNACGRVCKDPEVCSSGIFRVETIP